jgi:hypothetical protein
MKNIVRLVLLSFLFAGVMDVARTGRNENGKNYKNTVRVILTNPLIFGEKSLIVGYERTLGAHKAFL